MAREKVRSSNKMKVLKISDRQIPYTLYLKLFALKITAARSEEQGIFCLIAIQFGDYGLKISKKTWSSKFLHLVLQACFTRNLIKSF